jgi:hypothetical protein
MISSHLRPYLGRRDCNEVVNTSELQDLRQDFERPFCFCFRRCARFLTDLWQSFRNDFGLFVFAFDQAVRSKRKMRSLEGNKKISGTILGLLISLLL